MTPKSPIQMSLDLLSRRAYSERGMIEKLAANQYSEEEITECIQRLKSWGYLNDRDFGINRLKSLKSKLKSRAYVRNDLLNSGLTSEICNVLMDMHYSEEAEINIALELLQKKFNKRPKTTSQRAFFLQRAGFSEDTIHHCFPNISAP